MKEKINKIDVENTIETGAKKVAEKIAEMIAEVISKFAEDEYQATDKHTSFIHSQIAKRAIELLPDLIASKLKK